jgi:sarcosine oxidase subunit alpha
MWAWVELAIDAVLEADLCIVGGGIAGLSAAVAAARSGERVVLVERRRWLGGDARYFGSMEGEPSPELMLARLNAALVTHSGITLLKGAEAFSLADGRVRVHQVGEVEGELKAQILEIVAPRLLLATGSVERLPVFPGNRLPGVVTSAAAFHRASRYGVWHGGTALLSTASSIAYRLAIRAMDAGITLTRLTDTREEPRSRFLEFAKAYGATLMRGLVPVAAQPRDAGRKAAPRLAIRFAESFMGQSRETGFEAEQLIVSGGFRPELGLWLMAGGGCEWLGPARGFAARGDVAGVAIAGSAAGHGALAACAASGERAVAELFGREVHPIEERLIEAAYETPDGPLPVVTEPGSHPAYLDGGGSFNALPQREPARPLERFMSGHVPPARPFPIVHAMSPGDLAAAVTAGLAPSEEAGELAAERCLAAFPALQAAPERRGPKGQAAALDHVPRYLENRFGEDAEVWTITATDDRVLEAGTLLMANSDETDPTRAVGVVLGGALALLGRAGRGAPSLVARAVGSAAEVLATGRPGEAPPERDGEADAGADVTEPSQAADPPAVAAAVVLAAEIVGEVLSTPEGPEMDGNDDSPEIATDGDASAGGEGDAEG